MDFTKEEFINFWADRVGGYEEGFPSYYSYENDVRKCIVNNSNKDFDCLEIGCGSGYWTQQFLVPNFRSVTCVDFLPSPAYSDNMTYLQLDRADYSLSSFKNESFDFVYSFGVFCHLTNDANQEYLNNIFRVLKPNRTAIIMFANWPRKGVPYEDRYRNNDNNGGWFYNDLETTKKMVAFSGFKSFEDLLPNFRDTLGKLEK
jgi:SAM-dependent methyltransferase